MAARIAFLLPDLRMGGAEKVTLELVSGCLRRGYAVDVVVLQAVGELIGEFPHDARLVSLDAERIAAALPALRRYFCRERPMGVVAAMWPLPVLAILAAAGLERKVRIVAAEHGSLRRQYAGWTRLVMRLTMTLSYRFAAGVVGVSSGVAGEVAELAALPHRRVTPILNPVPRPSCTGGHQPWPAERTSRILTVGTLKPEKNHILLLRAFARLSAQSDAVLAIVGEGAERIRLETERARLGLDDRVLLPGFSLTPGDWYADADVFVLSSDHEGLSTVLIEALHAGVPVVATDCPFGPREILEGGRWGRLVPPGDEAALAAAIRQALVQPFDREELQARAARFSTDEAVAAYLALMEPS